jgi:serine/threonine protein kinase
MSFDKSQNFYSANLGDLAALNVFSDNLETIKRLSQGLHEIFLVKSKTLNQEFVVKVFPQEVSNKPSENFLKEIRLKDIKNPHIIKVFDYEIQTKVILNGQPSLSSYVLMEYAPFKDLYHLVTKEGTDLDDLFIRTLFHDIIEALEYLHSEGIYHLDLKLENLLIGENFQVKIADFDNCYKTSDGRVSFRGTECSRAFELAEGTCQNPASADVYSAGVILFTLKSGGVFPYLEGKNEEKINLYALFKNKPNDFWKIHSMLLGKNPEFFEEDFRALFLSMMNKDPEKRASIQDIKNSKWYNKKIYTKEEMIEIMKTKLSREC